jgi:hypothetical protein
MGQRGRHRVGVGGGENAVHGDVPSEGMRVVEARRPLGRDFSDGRLGAIGKGE